MIRREENDEIVIEKIFNAGPEEALLDPQLQLTWHPSGPQLHSMHNLIRLEDGHAENTTGTGQAIHNSFGIVWLTGDSQVCDLSNGKPFSIQNCRQ